MGNTINQLRGQRWGKICSIICQYIYGRLGGTGIGQMPHLAFALSPVSK